MPTPKCHARLTAIVVAPTPPRTPVTAIARPPSMAGAAKALPCAKGPKCRSTFSRVIGFLSDFAVEVGMLDLADDQHADIGFDDMGQFAQCAQRLFLAGDIDDEYTRRRG